MMRDSSVRKRSQEPAQTIGKNKPQKKDGDSVSTRCPLTSTDSPWCEYTHTEVNFRKKQWCKKITVTKRSLEEIKTN